MAACSAPGAPNSPARSSASTALTAGEIDLEGPAGSPSRNSEAGDRRGLRARAGEPQIRRPLLQLRRLPEHLHRRARTASAGTDLISPQARARAGPRASSRDLEITPAAEDKEVGYLSGGNQQKIVIARWLFAGADLFILDEPTQGIDIGARIAVYRLINRLTAPGKAVILISSDHDELLADDATASA